MSCALNSDGSIVYLHYKKEGKKKMINWNTIVKTVGRDTLVEFVDGRVSGRELTESVAYTKAAGEVRSLLRERGINEARRLASKALSRR